MNLRDPHDEAEMLTDNSLAFFGAITASVSHELNNVISIINQTAGLLDDLLAGAREGRPLKTERLERMAQTLKDQTERGIGIIKRLNRFAHSADESRREYDVNEVAENLVALTGRLASMKRASLELRTSGHPVSLVGNPFHLQQAIFLLIRQALSNVQDDDILFIEVSELNGGARVELKGMRRDTEGEFAMEYLGLLVNHIGGTVDPRASAERMDVAILIPGKK